MFQTVRERKSDRCDGAEADRTVLRCDAIPRTQSVQVDARFHSIFKTMDPGPFTGMTVYSFLFQQRKADKHYTGLGGCSSWQRPEQSRWSQQVRWAKNAFFFSFLYSVFSLHSASCASQSAAMFSIFLLCSKCFYSIHQPQKASVVCRYNGNVNLDASDP